MKRVGQRREIYAGNKIMTCRRRDKVSNWDSSSCFWFPAGDPSILTSVWCIVEDDDEGDEENVCLCLN